MHLETVRDLRPVTAWLGWMLALGAGALLVAAATFPFGRLPTMCAFLLLTDLPCLTCGMTRSWVALVHGDVLDALLWNPGGVALCVITGAAAVYAAARQLGAPAVRLRSTARERRVLRGLLVVAVVVNWSYVVLAGRV